MLRRSGRREVCWSRTWRSWGLMRRIPWAISRRVCLSKSLSKITEIFSIGNSASFPTRTCSICNGRQRKRNSLSLTTKSNCLRSFEISSKGFHSLLSKSSSTRNKTSVLQNFQMKTIWHTRRHSRQRRLWFWSSSQFLSPGWAQSRRILRGITFFKSRIR